MSGLRLVGVFHSTLLALRRLAAFPAAAAHACEARTYPGTPEYGGRLIHSLPPELANQTRFARHTGSRKCTKVAGREVVRTDFGKKLCRIAQCLRGVGLRAQPCRGCEALRMVAAEAVALAFDFR